MPRAIGELLAGVALGPSLLGQVSPRPSMPFPANERQAGLLLGLAWIGIVFLLGITGADIYTSTIRRQGRAATTTTIGSLVLPARRGVRGVPAPRWVPRRRIAYGVRAVLRRGVRDLLVAGRGPTPATSGSWTARSPISHWRRHRRTTSAGWAAPRRRRRCRRIRHLRAGLLGVAALGVLLGTSFVVLKIAHPRPTQHRTGSALRRPGGGDQPPHTLRRRRRHDHARRLHSKSIGAFIAGIAVGASRLRHSGGFAALEAATNGIFAPLFFAIAGIRVDLTGARRRVRRHLGGRRHGRSHCGQVRRGRTAGADSAVSIDRTPSCRRLAQRTRELWKSSSRPCRPVARGDRADRLYGDRGHGPL